ncbi:MAG: autotransporter domain-containing protein, partial [Deltaproteobacteria bacterium]|nr:autotransporter domain-containing protein [Deltaproteobacteria bacterium]
AGKLVGTSSSLQGVIDILDSAILGFDQDDDGTFEGVMSGGGDAFKRGAGSLVLEGTQAARQVDVYGGGLIVGAASQSSAELGADIVNVYSGAFLGGHGTVSSDVVVHAGGRLSPGNSYGITRIGGDLEFKSGSYFDVEVNPFNTAEGDVAYVSGTAYLAGIVRHLETGGTADDYLKAGNEWLILDAADLSGTFDGAVSNLAFLLPQLRYDDVNADVYLSFVRGGATFADFADTRNRRSVAAALESLDPGSVLLTEIAYSGTTVDQVPGLLDDLSGEMHGAVGGGLFQLGRGFANMLSRHVGGLSRFGSGAPAPAAGSPGQGGNSFWAVAGGTYTVMKGTGETARATLTGPEVSVGYDHVSADGWLAGLAFQYGYKKMKMGARSSEAEVNSLTVGLYGGREVRLGPGALRVVLSGSYSHHDIDSTRRVFMGTAAQTLEASYSARSFAGDLEVAYRFPVTGSLSLEPYARIGVQRIRFGGFAERGGSAALTSLGESWSHAVSTAGLRLLLAGNDRVSFSADLGWQHTFGNLAPSATYAFREGGSGFTVTGSPMNRNEALVGLELGINVTDSVSFQLGYNGSFGSRGQSHGGNAMVEVKW